MVQNALAAVACAHAARLPLTAIVQGLEAFRPLRGRLATTTTAAGVHVIDDSYNANPDSVLAAIDVLAERPAPRVLVLGDMGEVGDAGPAFHREIGAHARKAGIERMCTVGTLAHEAASAFGPNAAHYASVDALARDIASTVVAGTSVLVKGSRFMRTERVVAALTGEPTQEAH